MSENVLSPWVKQRVSNQIPGLIEANLALASSNYIDNL